MNGVSDPELSDGNLEDELTMALLDGAGESLGTQSVRLHRRPRRSSRQNSGNPLSSDEASDQELMGYNDRSDNEVRQIDSDEESEFFRKKISPKKKAANTRATSNGQNLGAASQRPKRRVFLDESDHSDDEKPSTFNQLTSKVKRKKLILSDDEDENYMKQLPTTSKAEFKYVPVKKNQFTIDIEREERERMKRVAEKQAKYNNVVFENDAESLDKALSDSFNKKRTAKALILDQHEDEKVSVHPSIVRHLKPHQLKGVQFLYDCTIESMGRLDKPGGGGILAHCMGLGKTLQTIAYLHTVMTHPTISQVIHRVIVVCPKNVVLNWEREFQKWLFANDSTMPEINVFELDSLKTYGARKDLLETWFNCKRSSVLIVGYEMFRILTQDYTKPNKKTGKIPAEDRAKRKLVALQPEFRRYLQNPGPDLIVCDEGHKLKNIKAEVTITINDIRTKRRICLTGTPLQNNLGEYYTMVNFIKPGLLGTPDEFSDRFELPIKKGQTKDADALDVAQMRRRCFVLYTRLQGIIDRRDFTVLKDALMPKLEYVISVRLSEKQAKLYQLYLDAECGDPMDRRKRLFAHYYNFSRIFSHPYQLIIHQEEKDVKDARKLDDFIVDESEEEDSDDEPRRRPKSKPRQEESEGSRPNTPVGWFEDKGILEEEDRDNFALSYKLMILVEILKESETIGDKVLVFSQSLETLRLIRRMLDSMAKDWFSDGHEAVLKRSKEKWSWEQNKDYMLITGQVSSKERDIIQQKFNSQNSARNRLCLISTKAGSLGTNFVAANRVVIFDQNWNPSHDRQALFRAYRFGQTKPVYIYRLVAFGTMEDRIYARQVTKESVSCRVIDENQVKRHYTAIELEDLFQLELSDYDATKPPLYAPPEDELLGCVFSRLKEGVVNCIQHDSLLAHVEDEVLDEEERKKAWDEFNKNINTRQARLQATAAQNLSDFMDSSTSQDEDNASLFSELPPNFLATLSQMLGFDLHNSNSVTNSAQPFLQNNANGL